MGVDLTELVPRGQLDLDELPKETVAVDGNNALYQFLSTIRQPDGTPLMNSKGVITSHLQGLFYRTINLLELGLKCVYVFDGEILPLKRRELERRSERRRKAAEEADIARELGLVKEAYKKSVQASRLSRDMVEQAKLLLNYMGVPCVSAPYEGEAQAARIVLDSKAYAVASQDYDSLVFGAPRLLRNLAITGRRKLPNKEEYIEVKPELIHLDEVLSSLAIDRRKLVWLAVLVGTDYNPDGFPGIGPKTALKLVREHSSFQDIVSAKGLKVEFDFEEVEQEFLNPHVNANYEIKWGRTSSEDIIRFLCEENDFSVARVKAALERLARVREGGFQQSLEKWF
jgi:flap endonuclease-1